jgi:hypothetical protein
VRDRVPELSGIGQIGAVDVRPDQLIAGNEQYDSGGHDQRGQEECDPATDRRVEPTDHRRIR